MSRAWLARGHIPSLDGLRTFSILVVLIAHLCQQGTLIPRVAQVPALGYLGVDMFFVLSGFIITMLLLREFQRTQAISLKHFYLRRAFRILPAYVCFLLGIGLFTWMGSVDLRMQDWLAALTYTVSFLETAPGISATSGRSPSRNIFTACGHWRCVPGLGAPGSPPWRPFW